MIAMTPTFLDPFQPTATNPEALASVGLSQTGFADLLFASMFDAASSDETNLEQELDQEELETETPAEQTLPAQALPVQTLALPVLPASTLPEPMLPDSTLSVSKSPAPTLLDRTLPVTTALSPTLPPSSSPVVTVPEMTLPETTMPESASPEPLPVQTSVEPVLPVTTLLEPTLPVSNLPTPTLLDRTQPLPTASAAVLPLSPSPVATEPESTSPVLPDTEIPGVSSSIPQLGVVNPVDLADPRTSVELAEISFSEIPAVDTNFKIPMAEAAANFTPAVTQDRPVSVGVEQVIASEATSQTAPVDVISVADAAVKTQDAPITNPTSAPAIAFAKEIVTKGPATRGREKSIEHTTATSKEDAPIEASTYLGEIKHIDHFEAILPQRPSASAVLRDSEGFAPLLISVSDDQPSASEPLEAGERSQLTELILDRFEASRPKMNLVQRSEGRLPLELRVIDQVRDQVITFIPAQLGKESKDILKMRLNPAELGHVEIELARDSAGTISAHIRTETESAQHILIEGLNELRDSLRDAGVEVGNLEVSTSSTSSGEKDGRGNESRRAGAHDLANGMIDSVDLDHETEKEDRLVSLRA